VCALATLQGLPGRPVPGWHGLSACTRQAPEPPPASVPSHLTLGLLQGRLTAAARCSTADSFQWVKITECPSSTRSHQPWTGIFPNHSVMFAFSAGKDAFKATNGSESFIQSISYEWLCTARALGRGGCHRRAPRQSSQPSPGRGGRRAEVQVWYPHGSIFAATRHQAFKERCQKPLCQSEKAKGVLPT